MKLGKRMFTLWQLRPWVIASTALAALVALWSVANISLFPPKLTPRALEMATGTTHVLVDTPKSTVLDLRQNTYDFQALTQRAVLLANVMANGQVRAAIAQRAHVPVELLQVAPPLTAAEPRAVSGSNDQKHTSDLLKSTDQYRLSLQVNPTVPVLDVYSQAPTAGGAASLANAAVDSLRSYLGSLASRQRIAPKDQIQLLQLGRAQGRVINHGIEWQTAFLAFALTFAFACATVIFMSRITHGWRMAALADQQTAG